MAQKLLKIFEEWKKYKQKTLPAVIVLFLYQIVIKTITDFD